MAQRFDVVDREQREGQRRDVQRQHFDPLPVGLDRLRRDDVGLQSFHAVRRQRLRKRRLHGSATENRCVV